jgi:hypothetical protein
MEDENAGSLKSVHLEDPERQVFLEYMSKIRKDQTFDILYNILDDPDMFMFCDCFAGQTIKVPSREELKKIVLYCRIYQFITARGGDEVAYQQASTHFDKRIHSLKRIVLKVDSVLHDKDPVLPEISSDSGLSPDEEVEVAQVGEELK